MHKLEVRKKRKKGGVYHPEVRICSLFSIPCHVVVLVFSIVSCVSWCGDSLVRSTLVAEFLNIIFIFGSH